MIRQRTSVIRWTAVVAILAVATAGVVFIAAGEAPSSATSSLGLDCSVFGPPLRFRYPRDHVFFITSCFFVNKSAEYMKVRAVTPDWQRRCRVTTSPAALFNGDNGVGQIPAGSMAYEAAGLGPQYGFGRVRMRPHWGGGWFVAINLRIPSDCRAVLDGFTVRFQLADSRPTSTFLPERYVLDPDPSASRSS